MPIDLFFDQSTTLTIINNHNYLLVFNPVIFCVTGGRGDGVEVEKGELESSLYGRAERRWKTAVGDRERLLPRIATERGSSLVSRQREAPPSYRQRGSSLVSRQREAPLSYGIRSAMETLLIAL